MKQLSALNIARLRTEEAFGYLKQVVTETENLPSEEPAAALTAAVTTLTTGVDAFDDALKASATNPATATATAADDARDAAWRGVNNYNVAVREYGDRIIFLRQIVPGSTDRSYGIHVAKLAGLPAAVIRRANEILETLENSADTPRAAMQSLPRQAVRSKSRRKGAASDENPEELFQPGLF